MVRTGSAENLETLIGFKMGLRCGGTLDMVTWFGILDIVSND